MLPYCTRFYSLVNSELWLLNNNVGQKLANIHGPFMANIHGLFII